MRMAMLRINLNNADNADVTDNAVDNARNGSIKRVNNNNSNGDIDNNHSGIIGSNDHINSNDMMASMMLTMPIVTLMPISTTMVVIMPRMI